LQVVEGVGRGLGFQQVGHAFGLRFPGGSPPWWKLCKVFEILRLGLDFDAWIGEKSCFSGLFGAKSSIRTSCGLLSRLVCDTRLYSIGSGDGCFVKCGCLRVGPQVQERPQRTLRDGTAVRVNANGKNAEESGLSARWTWEATTAPYPPRSMWRTPVTGWPRKAEPR